MLFRSEKLELNEPTKNYKKIAENIVKSRKETIETPKQAVEDGVKTAEALLEEIKKNFQFDKREEQAS